MCVHIMMHLSLVVPEESLNKYLSQTHTTYACEWVRQCYANAQTNRLAVCKCNFVFKCNVQCADAVFARTEQFAQRFAGETITLVHGVTHEVRLLAGNTCKCWLCRDVPGSSRSVLTPNWEMKRPALFRLFVYASLWCFSHIHYNLPACIRLYTSRTFPPEHITNPLSRPHCMFCIRVCFLLARVGMYLQHKLTFHLYCGVSDAQIVFIKWINRWRVMPDLYVKEYSALND